MNATAEPITFPNVNDWPALVEARATVARVANELAAVTTERAALEKKLGVANFHIKATNHERLTRLRAKAVLAGRGKELEADFARLAELYDREPPLRMAVEMAEAEAEGARQVAVRALSVEAVKDVFEPRLREVAKLWLAFAAEGAKLAHLATRIEQAGLGNGLVNHFAGQVPASDNHIANFGHLANQLIHAGHLTRAEIDAAVPGGIPR